MRVATKEEYIYCAREDSVKFTLWPRGRTPLNSFGGNNLLPLGIDEIVSGGKEASVIFSPVVRAIGVTADAHYADKKTDHQGGNVWMTIEMGGPASLGFEVRKGGPFLMVVEPSPAIGLTGREIWNAPGSRGQAVGEVADYSFSPIPEGQEEMVIHNLYGEEDEVQVRLLTESRQGLPLATRFGVVLKGPHFALSYNRGEDNLDLTRLGEQMVVDDIKRRAALVRATGDPKFLSGESLPFTDGSQLAPVRVALKLFPTKGDFLKVAQATQRDSDRRVAIVDLT